MLATTIQITNNPPHTPTPTTTAGWLRGQPPQNVADAHTVLNVNPTVCSLAKTFLCPTQNTHPHPQEETLQAGCAGNHHHNGGGRSHGVEREPDSVLIC